MCLFLEAFSLQGEIQPGCVGAAVPGIHQELQEKNRSRESLDLVDKFVTLLLIGMIGIKEVCTEYL